MEPEKRETGISIVGSIPWGTHFCFFYELEEDLLQVLVPYFKTGLESNEFCLWIVSPPFTTQRTIAALRQGMPDLDHHLAQRNIEFLDYAEWYLQDGVFDLHRVIRQWQEKVADALARGYAGLRGVGNLDWLTEHNWRDFVEYEKELDRWIADERMIAACTYSLTRSSGIQVFDVAGTHEYAIARRRGNWQLFETPELVQAKQEIRKLNQELEQRVAERTGELAASNRALTTEIAERNRVEAAEREQRALAEALRDTAAALNSTLDFNAVLDRILGNLGRVVNYETATIKLLQDDIAWVVRHTGYAERGLQEVARNLRFEVSSTQSLRQIVETGKPIIISDTENYPGWRVLPGMEWVRSYLGAAIRFQGEVVGFISVNSAQPGFYTSSDAEHLQAFADQAALALQNARLWQEVSAARARLQTLSDQLLVAQEEERRGIARELHDEVGQVLNAVSVNLRALEISADPLTRGERMEESLKLVDEALTQVRDLALELRPSMLDDFGLAPALEWYAERETQRSGYRAEFHINLSDNRLAPQLETTIYRVVQIALTNVTRHAQANLVQIELDQQGLNLELVIRDDGVGFEVETAFERAARGETLGLLSMQERVRLAHGEMQITSARGEGTVIRVRFRIGGVV